MDHPTSLPPEVDSPAGGSPELFRARLNQKLRDIGLVVESLPRRASHPPCFERPAYDAWLAQASVSMETVPYRLSMPAEPNYCRDCTIGFKAAMVGAGLCVFPGVVFEEAKVLGESEVVGLSRPTDVDPDVYPIYAGLVHKRRPECLTETSLLISPPPPADPSSPPSDPAAE